ncbi:MAG: hypothetical protein JSR17_06640 [Proteobacteria bacterium]|nr:hypothetical protein [Pseudomonadota bacterium]
MGTNTRIHHCEKIQKFLLLCLTPTFFDVKAELIFRKTANSEQLTDVITTLDAIDWQQDIDTLRASMKDCAYDPHLLASAVKQYMQHGAIIPHNFTTKITWELFLQQLKANQNDDQKVHYLLAFIGQLIEEDDVDAAMVIHNFLHLGKCVANYSSTNKMDENAIGQLFGSILLDALELDGCIFKKEDKDIYGSKALADEMKMIGQLVTSLLKTELFSNAFSREKYTHFKQEKDHRELIRAELGRQIWTLPPLDKSPLSTLVEKFTQLSLEPTAEKKQASSGSLSVPRLTLPDASGYVSGDEREEQPAIVRQFSTTRDRSKKLQKRKSFEDISSSSLTSGDKRASKALLEKKK